MSGKRPGSKRTGPKRASKTFPYVNATSADTRATWQCQRMVMVLAMATDGEGCVVHTKTRFFRRAGQKQEEKGKSRPPPHTSFSPPPASAHPAWSVRMMISYRATVTLLFGYPIPPMDTAKPCLEHTHTHTHAHADTATLPNMAWPPDHGSVSCHTTQSKVGSSPGPRHWPVLPTPPSHSSARALAIAQPEPRGP